MISRLRGTIEQLSGHVATVDVQGVGYEVFCSGRTVEQLEQGREATLIIFTEVREDAIRLFGFIDQIERQVFGLLIQVQGIGCKTAADILSKIEARELLRMLGAGDMDRLQAIKGIGKKTAQRLVVELKDKVGEFVADRPGAAEPAAVAGKNSTQAQEAVQAMQALGFSAREAERAVQAVLEQHPLSGMSAGEMVKEALRFV